MARKLGMQGKAYYATAGGPILGDDAWSILDNVRDVTIDMDTAEADVTTRNNNGWKAKVGTLKEGKVSFEMIWDPEDAGFEAIFDAFLASSVLGMAFMDGDITTVGSEGLVGDFMVTKCTRDEKLEDAMKAQIEVSLTYSQTDPEWLVVASA